MNASATSIEGDRPMIETSWPFKAPAQRPRPRWDGVRSGLLALALLFAPLAASAQGYAGLGTAVEGFDAVTRPADLAFPRDHAPHPGFRIEWWYLTAALTGPDGADYGAQWTLFRVATRPGPETQGWDSNQLWIGHAAATSATVHHAAERFARGGTGQAGVTPDPFAAWIDDWTLATPGAPADPFDAVTVSASGPGFSYTLTGRAEGPLVRQGEAGYSLKSDAGQASYYYSQPFLRVEGRLTLDGAAIPVTGRAWIDREWSSQAMGADQQGWDWFSLHLDDGDRVMLYRLRGTTGPARVFGTWMTPSGESRPLGPAEMTPTAWTEVAGRRLPTAWRLSAPGLGLAVDTEALNAQSWNEGRFPYWEGPIRVTGSHPGRGYLEMVGY